jgi:hypothetical protein
LTGSVHVVVEPDRIVAQRLGDVRVRRQLALEEGEEEVRVPLLPVVDGVDGDFEERREVLVGVAEAAERLGLLRVLRLELRNA